jgi:hypothetical protein
MSHPSIILSVDIGHQYLAYALYSEKQVTDPETQCSHFFDPTITYGIFSFKETDCINRCESIVEFLHTFYPDHLIIEKQVGMNVRAIELQYALAATAHGMGVDVEIQPALTKFQVLGEVCDTRGKAHKALSAKIALDWLQNNHISDCSVSHLREYMKQDDIADAINMLRASPAFREEYRQFSSDIEKDAAESECPCTSSDQTTPTI